ETAAGRRIDGGGIDTIGNFAIGQNTVHETAAETIVARNEVLSTIYGNHHAVVVRADIDRIRIARMNGDRIDLQLARRGDHPGIVVAPFCRAPEPFRRAGKNQTWYRWVLEDCAGAARLRRNALNLMPALTSIAGIVDAAAG